MPALKRTRSGPEQLTPLVAWWLGHHGVEIDYKRNIKNTGKVAPEYDAILWLNERRINERALANIVMSRLMDLGHKFTMAQVLGAIHAFIWDDYVHHCAYDEETKTSEPVWGKPGRPRKNGTAAVADK